MELYSAMRKEDILPFVTTWMDLEETIPTEISQTEKDQILYNLTYMWTLKKKNS